MIVGIAGFGSMGRKYASWISKLGHTPVVFDPHTSGDDSCGYRFLDSISDCINEGAERFIVASPPSSHFNIAAQLVRARIPLLIEKPIDTNLERVEELIKLSSFYNVKSFGVANMRFHPGFRALSDALTGKDILLMRGHFHHRLSQMRPAGGGEYAKDEAEGGGILLDCIHDLDLLMQIKGAPSSVKTDRFNTEFEGLIGADCMKVSMQWDEPSSRAFGCLSLDYLSARKSRGIEVVTRDNTFRWLSDGKKPELVTVSSANNGLVQELLRLEDYESSDMFLEMLSRFFLDGEGLQTLEEAYSVLTVAKKALRD